MIFPVLKSSLNITASGVMYSAVSRGIKTWSYRKGTGTEVSLTFPFDALHAPTSTPQVFAVEELCLREHLPLLSENSEEMAMKVFMLLKSCKPALDSWRAQRALPILPFSLPSFPFSAFPACLGWSRSRSWAAPCTGLHQASQEVTCRGSFITMIQSGINKIHIEP